MLKDSPKALAQGRFEQWNTPNADNFSFAPILYGLNVKS